MNELYNTVAIRYKAEIIFQRLSVIRDIECVRNLQLLLYKQIHLGSKHYL